MTSINPSTGQPLPPDAIQRVLFIASKVHIYQIPPLTSTKGYNAAVWTADNNARQIFTARLRIIETAIPTPDGSELVTTDILLEDPSNGQLFAAAPYTTPAVVEQVLDSSRFFAIMVQGDGGRKAILGMGFEERSEAFDFGVTLQEVRRVNGLDNLSGAAGKKVGRSTGSLEKSQEKKDFSLKEGETITVNIGGKGRRSRDENRQPSSKNSFSSSPFSLPPPPSHPRLNGEGKSSTLPFLPPPPSAQDVKAQRRLSRQLLPQEGDGEARTDFGFDDGEFGEFQ
jgi:adaptin ear-binding coat-associated protein 1/2